MDRDSQSLVNAIDHLEDVLASYFKDKDVPVEISVALTNLEVAMIKAGLSPLQI